MNSLTIGFISAGCIFGGVLLGSLLQKVLPPHHLESDSKDTVKLGAGMVTTLTALVLGLLVSSAKGSFNAMNAGIAQTGAKILLVESYPRRLRSGDEGGQRAITTFCRVRN